MADLKKISVIIPAYNAERFINKCVESLLKQSYKNVEIVIVINGSRDNTPAICEELADKYNNIKLVKLNPNQGTNWARRAGFEASDGDYITFSDSDDYIEPAAYEKAIKVIEENNLDIVQFGLNLVTPDGKVLGQDSPSEMRFNNTRDNFLYALTLAGALWDKAYRRSMFENLEWAQMSYFEDSTITIQLFAHAKKFMTMQETFYYYVQNSNSSTHRTHRSTMRDDGINSGNLIADFTRKNIAVCAVGLRQALLDDADDDLIGHQLACLDIGLGLQSHGRAVFDGSAQDVAGGDRGNVPFPAQDLGLGALAGAGGA